ncbi:hypothetical protein EW145_g1154 [Phellinidium pouzarii]|uniref:FAD/NAD(P)-binding domain-containing protein n=1 Tax=Phellinidium pouzarii TaxID=167371 RepID=A0A4S4LHE9_9AGAM|nr:hypothetical protein EW145_g1154 [Phellinidium pouzarii]
MYSYSKEQPRVAIIGGGIAGISTAVALKRQLSFTNFLIYEKGSDIGGTWRDNTYPGCSSDIAGHWYSLSSDRNPNWSSYLVYQPEILAYWKSIARKYLLHNHLNLHTRVVSAVWDDATQKYRLTLKDERTGVEREETVEAIVSATGVLSNPAYPIDIPDLDKFSGPMFHSARWNHDVSLSGKRIGVIGNAASAFPLLRRLTTKSLTEHIEATAPKEYVSKLIPDYAPGCRRILLDTGYMKSLHQENVTLVWDNIGKVVPEGIVKKDGELIPLDVIVLATGFDLESMQVDMKGSGGKTMQEYFNEQGGPTAYLGTTVPGFPNYFMLMGPNTTTGHNSIVFSEEAQIDYAVQLLKPVIEKKATSFAVRPEAADEYNRLIKKLFGGSVFMACKSWYRANREGKNTVIFPGPLILFWWWARRPRWGDYEARGADAWIKERRRRTLIRIVFMVLLLLGLAGAAQPPARDVSRAVLAKLLSRVPERFKFLRRWS